MSEKKLQIFIGSTYTDLRAERDALTRAILRTGHIPVGMELFQPSDEESWRVITQFIDTSDGYFLVLGHRYGTIHKQHGIGFTEMEYEYAKSQKIPIYAMILSREEKKDRDETNRHRELYDKFRSKLMEERNIREWTNAHDLETMAATIIATDNTLKSRPGWHRSRSDAEASHAEIAQPSKASRDSKAEVERIRASSESQVSTRQAIEQMASYTYSYDDLCPQKSMYAKPRKSHFSLLEFIRAAYREIASGLTFFNLTFVYYQHFFDSNASSAPHQFWRAHPLDDLCLLGITEARQITVERPSGLGAGRAWYFTDLGRRVIHLLREDSWLPVGGC